MEYWPFERLLSGIFWPIERLLNGILAHWTIIKWNNALLNDYKMNIGPLNLYRMWNCHNDPLLKGIFAILTFIESDIGPLNILIWGIWFYIENVNGISSILYCIVFVWHCAFENSLCPVHNLPHTFCSSLRDSPATSKYCHNVHIKHRDTSD